jgi:SAM-dependent methyltransferase
LTAADDALLEASREFYWYHQIDLGNGVRTDGDLDMREVLPHYGFPQDMSGMRVLDVGRASGFFAFEFEARGANVTATEISSYLDWDFVGGEPERQRRASKYPDMAAFTRRHITGAFEFAHTARGSKVRPVSTTIYDISLEKLEADRPFDLVFAGSITSHLRDPLRGFDRFFEVTAPGGHCIVSAPFVGADEQTPTLIMVTGDPDRRSWWVMNRSCLTASLKAVGFETAEIKGEFDTVIKRNGARYPHIVAHAKRGAGYSY